MSEVIFNVVGTIILWALILGLWMPMIIEQGFNLGWWS